MTSFTGECSFPSFEAMAEEGSTGEGRDGDCYSALMGTLQSMLFAPYRERPAVPEMSGFRSFRSLLMHLQWIVGVWVAMGGSPAHTGHNDFGLLPNLSGLAVVAMRGARDDHGLLWNFRELRRTRERIDPALSRVEVVLR